DSPGGVLAGAASAVARLAPGLGLRAIDSSHVSRNPDVVESYRADPLVHHGKTPAATLAALLLAGSHIMRNSSRLTLPALLLHGATDHIVSNSGSRALFREAASVDKVLKVYPDCYHELLNEPEQEDVMADILAWLNGHIRPPR